MADINHVVLVGRLVRDAELKYASSGVAITKFGLAVNRRRKQGDQWTDEANFFDVVVMGRMGEAIQRYLTKGKQVGIEGELRQSKWEQDGQPRSRVEVFANNVQLLGSPGEQRSGAASEASARGSGSSEAGRAGIDDDFEDDVPF